MTDPRLARGLQRQLDRRRRLLESGQGPLGWKAGFGAPAAQGQFGLDGPLVGFMTEASLRDDGAVVDITGWGRAVAEPEIFVRLEADLGADADEDTARRAIGGIGPALELANIQPPPEDVEEILAGNIYHESVILGPEDGSRRGGDLSGLEARVRVGGDELYRTTALEDLTGRVPEVLAHLARLISTQGERMRSGEVVICGSVVPPIDLAPGTSVVFDLHPIGVVSVQAG